MALAGRLFSAIGLFSLALKVLCHGDRCSRGVYLLLQQSAAFVGRRESGAKAEIGQDETET